MLHRHQFAPKLSFLRRRHLGHIDLMMTFFNYFSFLLSLSNGKFAFLSLPKLSPPKSTKKKKHLTPWKNGYFFIFTFTDHSIFSVKSAASMFILFF